MLLALALAGCGRGARVDAAVVAERAFGELLRPLDATARRDALRRAHIFEPVDIAARDPRMGPPDELVLRADEPLTCSFYEPMGAAMTGSTPKFACGLLPSKQILRIKYGRTNREIYGEVLGSRLLWMLGVAADGNYPVHVRCLHCPDDPWAVVHHPRTSGRERRTVVEFEDAIVQRMYRGLILEECRRVEDGRCVSRRVDQGWELDELELLDEKVGGATAAERDAFLLLLAFIAHADDKHENHRIVCAPEHVDDGVCRRPRLMVADLGATFGRGAAHSPRPIDSRAHLGYAAWSSSQIWRDPGRCRAELHVRDGSDHPLISEAGRAFLAERLTRITDEQLRGLFETSRVARLQEVVEQHGVERHITVEDWIAIFKDKRRQIADLRCPR